jgi:hypothetical protein
VICSTVNKTSTQTLEELCPEARKELSITVRDNNLRHAPIGNLEALDQCICPLLCCPSVLARDEGDALAQLASHTENTVKTICCER